MQELDELNKSLRSLCSVDMAGEQTGDGGSAHSSLNALRGELNNKTQKYLQVMAELEGVNEELSRSCEENSQLTGRCVELEKKATRLVEMEEVGRSPALTISNRG